ncbi:MAG TPA: aldehyde dehydrogenase family protein, partial [Steroidobacteraceae bacterium]|nr:aldehyde dehydrogenase family protein [Steroidobacteraceae bacterium]
MPLQRTISPIDNSVCVERELASGRAIDDALDRARRAQREWRRVPVATRAEILGRFCDAFERRREAVAQELAWQMGRPVRYGPNEVRGTLERARHMIAIAPEALADVDVGPKEGFVRFLRREPLGVVFTVAAWNYPYLIAVNSVVPALMAGNVVVLKH